MNLRRVSRVVTEETLWFDYLFELARHGDNFHPAVQRAYSLWQESLSAWREAAK